MFSRIAIRSLDLHNIILENELFMQSERMDSQIQGNELQSERTDCLIPGNEWLIRENGLHNSI